ncbi:N-acetyltransferase 9 [Lecanosticta acicola]|uniref:N-acetyltransferase 9 n=1 Tax=Lecanosticta acicola TaxID=111012 RepID=A0AAI9E504_9PEZI|nr:N-acetyltransferase 9 [Lecanosticta acicola]
MQDADLQTATASEPLTLTEEFAMQRSWRADRDKLTFIVCFPLPEILPEGTLLRAGEYDPPGRMLGDVNLFLLPSDEEEGEEDSNDVDENARSSIIIGEIELMIARKEFHRRGFGRSALRAFLVYLLSHWEALATEYASPPPRLEFLRVKIQKSNVGSIRLFESVGFARTEQEANYFGEVELRWVPDFEDWKEKEKGEEEEGSLVELRYGLLS